MKKRRDKEKRVKANRFFTDRMTPREAFWNNYEKVSMNLHDDEDVHVLTYYGIGGIGKSRLLQELQIEMEANLENPCYIYYDFDTGNDMRSALQEMKSLLATKYKFKFSLYDLAEYSYSQKKGEKVSREEIQALVEKSPILDMLLSGAELIPIVGIIPQLIRLGDRGAQWVRNLVEDYKTEISDLSSMTKAELYASLPYYFALDLSENMQEQETPLVIFLDTYETLVNEMNMVGQPYSKDLWLRGDDGLIVNTEDVLWVIAGRERLKWDVLDADWSESLDQHLLESLSKNDIILFLEQSGMKPRSLCESMVELTGGTPVYLDLCMDQYDELVKNGIEPTEDKFGHNTETLLERFIKYMDGSVQDIVYILACLGRWEDSVIEKLGPQIISTFSVSNYDKVKGFSFVTRKEDGSYEIHKTVQEVLVEKCPERLRKLTYEKAIEIYEDICSSQMSLEDEIVRFMIPMICKYCCYLYQGKDLVEAYAKWMSGFLVTASMQGKTGTIDEVSGFLQDWSKKDTYALPLAMIESAELCVSEGDYESALVRVESGLQNLCELGLEDTPMYLFALRRKLICYVKLERTLEALEFGKTICEKYVAMLGYEEAKVRGIVAEYAKFLANESRLDEAVKWLTECYEAIKDIERISWRIKVNLQLTLADCYYWNNKDNEALAIRAQVYEEAKKHFEPGNVKRLHAGKDLLDSYVEVGQLEKAEQFVEEVKREFAKASNVTWMEETDLQEIEIKILRTKRRYNEAIAVYEKMYQIYQMVYGEGHHDTVSVGIDIADTLLAWGKEQQAIERYEQELAKLKERYGEEHVYTRMQCADYADMLLSIRHWDEALELAMQILEWRIGQHGEEHATVIDSYIQLAEIYYEMYDYENAETYAKKAEELASENPNLIWHKIRALNVMIRVWEIWGCRQDAADMNKQIWKMVYQMYGENHITTIEKELKYLVSLCPIGEAETAIEGIWSCYERMSKLVSEDYVEFVNVKYALMNAYAGAKKYAKALEIGRETELAYLELLNEVAMEVLDTQRVICECLKQLGLYDEAIAKNQEILNNLEESDKNTTATLVELRQLADLYYLKKEYAKSKELFERYLQLHLTISEEDHINIVTVYKCYGDIAMREGDYAKAIEQNEKMISAFIENEWDHWSDLNEAQMCNVVCYIGLKAYDKAFELFDQIDYFTEDSTEAQKMVGLLHQVLKEGLTDAAKDFALEIKWRAELSRGQWLAVKDIFAEHYMENGLLEDAKQTCLEMLELAEDARIGTLDADEEEIVTEMEKNALRNLTLLEVVLHHAEDAKKWAEKYLSVSQEFYDGYAYNQFFVLMDMAWTYQYIGMNESGQLFLTEAKARMEEFEVDEDDEFYYRRIRAKYLADAGEFEEAHVETDRLQELMEELDMSDYIMELNNTLAYLAFAEGRVEDAKAYLDEAIHKTQYTCNSNSPYSRECYEFRERIGD